MTNISVSSLILLLFLTSTACTLTSIEMESPTPTALIHVHSYFSAYAFLDTNDNGQPDSDDTPLKGATFIVALEGGTEFGSQTDDTGYAFISVPASVEYPVTLRMEAPEGSSLKLLEPAEISIPFAGESPKFLFVSE